MSISIWEGEKAADLVGAIERQNYLLSQLVTTSSQSATSVATLSEIHEIVRSGEASATFSVGDQINLNYNDGTNSYVLPWDIVHFGDVTLQDGETVPGMFIQSHYAMQGVQFDASEAIYYCASALASGTYYFTIGTTWGSNCTANTKYYFTTTQNIPAGGQIVIGTSSSFYTWGAPDCAPSTWKAYTFSSATSIAPIEGPLTLTAGTSGTNLGTISSDKLYTASETDGVNNLQRAAYGYNRWSHCGMRQWLNSSAAAGEWWASKNKHDRPPAQAATTRGFMAGFDSAFLSIIKPVAVTTVLNTVSDGAASNSTTADVTYDTFFCPSLYQEYAPPQIASAGYATEGEYWEYWRQRTGLTSPSTATNTYRIRYGYDAKTTARYVRLRSAFRGDACSAWCVYSGGNVADGYATGAIRPCPACVIC